MIRKMLLVTAAVMGLMAATGSSAQAGHCHHGGGYGRGYGGYGGYGYRGGPGYGYGGGVAYVPRVVPAPVYPYPVYAPYGAPYGGNPYGYGYAPYGQAFGVRSGNFSLFLGR